MKLIYIKYNSTSVIQSWHWAGAFDTGFMILIKLHSRGDNAYEYYIIIFLHFAL